MAKLQYVIALLTALMGGTAFGQSCGSCSKPVSRGYKQNNISYHEYCYRQALKCSSCSAPIVSGLKKHGDNLFHRKCFQKMQQCASCQLAILSGSYLKDDFGKTFHQICYEKAEKCGLCAAPVYGETVAQADVTYHAHCFDESRKCLVCTVPIRGAYNIDLYHRPSCLAHQSAHKCGTCGSPAVAWTLKDGRLSCARCQETAVYDGPDVLPNVLILKEFMAKQGLVLDKHLNFRLVARHELKLETGESHPLLVGLFSVERDGAARRETRTVSVLYGLPKTYFEAVAVHEFTHAWQDQFCPANQSEMLKEGTAELMSWLYLKQSGASIWASTIENKRVEPYASGFQKASTLYEQLGHEGFLKAITTLTDFPSSSD